MTDLTPLMKQYREIKRQHLDAILLFRMGDFYEMFDQDSLAGSGSESPSPAQFSRTRPYSSWTRRRRRWMRSRSAWCKRL